MYLLKYIQFCLIVFASVLVNTNEAYACAKSCDVTSIVAEKKVDGCCSSDSDQSKNDCKDCHDCSCCSGSVASGACFLMSVNNSPLTDFFSKEIYFSKTYFHIFSDAIWQPPKL